MMRKILNIQTILSLAFILTLLGCEYDQEVSDPVSPDGYPKVTFQTDFSGTSVTEGDTIMYTITLDKMLDKAMTFTVVVLDGTADESDFEVADATIDAYSLEATLMLVVTADDFPEIQETAKLEVGIDYIGEKYLVHPDTKNPVLDLTVNNYNNPARLTVAFGWDTPDDDIDCFAISEDNGDWGLAGTADNPEIMMDIWPDDPDGTYWFGIDPYHVEGTSFNYTISIGYPNQDPSVEFFYGTFDVTALDSYTTDFFEYWEVNSYRLMNIVNNGGVFTCTHLNE